MYDTNFVDVNFQCQQLFALFVIFILIFVWRLAIDNNNVMCTLYARKLKG